MVDLRRGSYSLQFHHRAFTGHHGNGNAIAEVVDNGVLPQNASCMWLIVVTLLSVLLVIVLIVDVELLRGRRTVQASLAAESDPASAAFRVFWHPFLDASEEPWVIFSNGAFVGRPETGMRYFKPKRDAKDQIWDHYTGVGEVLAIHELDQVFGGLHQRIRVKRGSLFSLDDANNNNVIFVGSPSENITLSDLPSTREFIFGRMTEGPRKGDLAILNVHARASEPKAFLASRSGTPITEDYAVVALMPGLNPARSLMVLAETGSVRTPASGGFLFERQRLRTPARPRSSASPVAHDRLSCGASRA